MRQVARSKKLEARRGVLLLSLTVLLFLGSAFAQTLTVLTHDSFAISEEIIEVFTAETGIEVEFLPAGDAGEVVNRAILTKDNPLGDVLYGIDNSLLARAVSENIFEPYLSPELENVNARYLFDAEGFVTPIDVGFVNFNLDKAYFEEVGLEPPGDISQLTEEAYRGLTAIQNPATSSPGLAFMLTTIARFGTGGETTWLDYWAGLRDNDVLVSSGWNDSYYTSFTRYGGDRPIVLSYASSPAAEVMFAEEALEDAPTSNLFCETCVYQQIEAAGILKGTDKLEAAKTFIDFMLGETFQSDIAPNMFVYPAVEDISLPKAFALYSQVPTPEQTAVLPEGTEENLQSWLGEWTQVVEQGRDPADLR